MAARISVAIIRTGNIDWLGSEKSATVDSESRRRTSRRRVSRGAATAATKKKGASPSLLLSLFLSRCSHNGRDSIRRQVEAMQTRERFNGGLGSTCSPSNREANLTFIHTLSPSLSYTRTHIFTHTHAHIHAHPLRIHIYPRIRPFALNACKFSDPNTHREIAAGNVRDVTWHGRHAYISRARTFGRGRKNG